MSGDLQRETTFVRPINLSRFRLNLDYWISLERLGDPAGGSRVVMERGREIDLDAADTARLEAALDAIEAEVRPPDGRSPLAGSPGSNPPENSHRAEGLR